MGRPVDGVWRDQLHDNDNTGGHFMREDSRFRNWITPSGGAGPTGGDGFKAEPGALTSTFPMPARGRTGP